MNAPVKLLVGLGNPTQKYASTRHNAGFWFLEALASRINAVFRSESRFDGDLAVFEPQSGQKVFLLKPQTFMNRSGKSVASLAKYFRIEAPEILVIHDELDFESGVIRLKRGGGHGGHNGLRDIIASLGGADFLRMRLGIGHPGNRDEVVGYVLDSPSKTDRALIDRSIDKGIQVVSALLNGQIDAATRLLHQG